MAKKNIDIIFQLHEYSASKCFKKKQFKKRKAKMCKTETNIKEKKQLTLLTVQLIINYSLLFLIMNFIHATFKGVLVLLQVNLSTTSFN